MTEKSFHNRRQNDNTEIGKRGRNMVSPWKKIYTPNVEIHNQEGHKKSTTFFLRREKFKLHISYLNPQILHRRDEPLKYFVFK